MQVETSLNELVNLLRYAPTGDNSQHWSFKIFTNKLEVFYLPKRGDHTLNVNNKAALLALGSVIEIVYIYCEESKLSIHDLEYNSEFDDKPVVIFEFKNSETDQDFIRNLVPMIKKRETSRKKFSKSEDVSVVIKEMETYSSKLDVKTTSIYGLTNKLKDYLVKCDQYIFSNLKAFEDTVKWVRFSKKEERSLDGFNLKNLNINFVDGLIFKLISKYTFLIKLFWPLGMNLKTKFHAQKTIDHSGNIIAFSTSDTKPESIINVGRVAYRTWLKLNEKGYGVQPLTVASMLAIFSRKGDLITGHNDSYKKIFNEADSLLKETFKLNQEEVVWMFRSGKCNPLSEEERTKRKPLEYYLATG